eukprot:7411300-Alexandrium_andersonii.AAC.1
MPCSPHSSDSLTQVVNSPPFSEFLEEARKVDTEKWSMMAALPTASQDTEAAELEPEPSREPS